MPLRLLFYGYTTHNERRQAAQSSHTLDDSCHLRLPCAHQAGGSRTKSLSIRGTDDAGGSNSNGTKAPRNPMCSVVLTGDDCRKVS